MPEAGQRGDQLDVARGAIFIQPQDVFGRKRGGARADARVAAEGERVLDVELQLVDLIPGELVRQFEEAFELRHAAARHIIVDAAILEVGPVVEAQAGQPPVRACCTICASVCTPWRAAATSRL